MRKPDFCLGENKGADQLRGNREADQRLCFRHSDSAISLLPKSEISSFLPYSETAQTGLCWTWSETPKTGFLTSRLILFIFSQDIQTQQMTTTGWLGMVSITISKFFPCNTHNFFFSCKIENFTRKNLIFSIFLLKT